MQIVHNPSEPFRKRNRSEPFCGGVKFSPENRSEQFFVHTKVMFFGIYLDGILLLFSFADICCLNHSSDLKQEQVSDQFISYQRISIHNPF